MEEKLKTDKDCKSFLKKGIEKAIVKAKNGGPHEFVCFLNDVNHLDPSNTENKSLLQSVEDIIIYRQFVLKILRKVKKESQKLFNCTMYFTLITPLFARITYKWTPQYIIEENDPDYIIY